AGDFRNRALGSEIAIENHEVAVDLYGPVERGNDFLVIRIRRHVGQVLGNRLPGDGAAVCMQQATFQQAAHQGADTANGDQLRHQVTAAGLQVRQYRYAGADAREVVDVQPHTGIVRNGEQVQDRIGRTAE